MSDQETQQQQQPEENNNAVDEIVTGEEKQVGQSLDGDSEPIMGTDRNAGAEEQEDFAAYANVGNDDGNNNDNNENANIALQQPAQNPSSNSLDNNNNNQEVLQQPQQQQQEKAPTAAETSPPPAPTPQHPDYLGDCFQDAVSSASLPAPFEGWTDLLTLPDSALLSRIGGEGEAGSPTRTTSVSSVLTAGTLPGEALTHPSRVLLRVLNRMSAEFRFLLMRQIDESDTVVQGRRESHNAMIDQMRKDNVAKLSTVLASIQQLHSSSSSTGANSPSSSASQQRSSYGNEFAEQSANNAIQSLERRLFSQQQQGAANAAQKRRNYGTALTAAAAGSFPGSRSQAGNESQRLKTYWRARYQQACSELEDVEQQIALATQDFLELDKINGASTTDQIKDLIEKCRVQEETAHAFAESCRMELKRAEIAAGRVRAQQEQENPSQKNPSSSSQSQNQGNKKSIFSSSRGAGGDNNDATTTSTGLNNSPSNTAGNTSNINEDGPSNNSMSATTKGGGGDDGVEDLSNLPFLVDSLSQHSPNAVQHAVSIRIKMQELQHLLHQVDTARETAGEKMEQTVEKAHAEYAHAVGRLPSHAASHFEQVIRSIALLEQAEDSLFDSQASMSEERLQFTEKRHDTTVMLESEKCRLMEQADKLKKHLRSAKLDLLRVERKRKDHASQPITAKDFTTTANTMYSASSSLTQNLSLGGSSNTTNLGGSFSNMSMTGATSANPQQQQQQTPSNTDAAAHLETMRAKVRLYELERQALMMDAMKAGVVASPTTAS